jgi:predicted nucleic acid-binding protein
VARTSLRIVVDTNEFVFALTGPTDSPPLRMLEVQLRARDHFEIRLPQIIVNECARNLPQRMHPQLFDLLNSLASIDPDYVVPFEVGERYRSLGLKPADALIAAYCDWIDADALVTENRHFLVRHRKHMPFEVLTADAFLLRHGGTASG